MLGKHGKVGLQDRYKTISCLHAWARPLAGSQSSPRPCLSNIKKVCWNLESRKNVRFFFWLLAMTLQGCTQFFTYEQAWWREGYQTSNRAVCVSFAGFTIMLMDNGVGDWVTGYKCVNTSAWNRDNPENRKLDESASRTNPYASLVHKPHVTCSV